MAPLSNTALRVTELDFDGIKNNLKNFLRNQSEFQDFDFDGSGMSILLDVLAYNTHYMSYYMNMIGNEMFLDTAQLRSSVLSHAKLTNYIPESRKGAQAILDIKITPSATEDQDKNIITLNKYTRLLGRDIDGTNYPFVTIYSNTSAKSSGYFSFNNVHIRQGDVVTRQFLMESGNNKRRFAIPSANVDTDTIVVTVQQSASNATSIVYNPADDITEIKNTSPVYFLEEEGESYVLTFGDNVLGRKPDNGNIITVTYLESEGAHANKISKFDFSQAVDGYRSNIQIVAANSSFGGSARETIEQIRFRAPYHYTTQNRAVTKKDYESLIMKDYQNIDSVSVWGGEENDPVQYGKIFISIKTKNNYSLSEIEKETIKDTLISNRNVLTVTPEIVDPEYVYVKIKGKVTYNPTITDLKSNQIKSLVLAAIDDYVQDDLNNFGSIFRKSKLQFYIDNADPSITASDLEVYVQKRQLIETGITKNYVMRYGLPIKKGDFVNKLISFPRIVMTDASDTNRNVFIEEVPQSFTGIDSIVVKNPGENYTSIPNVKITGDGTGAKATAEIVNGKIKKITVTDRGANYTSASVTISGGGGSSGTAQALTQSRFGTLRTYYNKTNGEKVIVNSNVGTIDYVSGIVRLTNMFIISVFENDLYELDTLTIDVPAEDEIIYPSRNKILTIDTNDSSAILIDVIAES